MRTILSILNHLILFVSISLIGINKGDIFGDIAEIFNGVSPGNIVNAVRNGIVDVPELVLFIRELDIASVVKAVDNGITDIPEMVLFQRELDINSVKNAIIAILTDVPSIPQIIQFTQDFANGPGKDILNTAAGVAQLLLDVPDVALKLANTTLFHIKQRQDADQAALAITLKACFNDVKQIASDYGVLDGQSALAEDLNIPDTMYHELALFLVYYKAQIEFVCNGKALELVNIFIQMMEQSAGISPPPPSAPQKECDSNGYCKAIKAAYPYGAYYDLLTFALTVDLFANDDLPAVIPDKTSYTDSNSFAQLKFVVDILEEMDYWFENVCDFFESCTDPFNIVDCGAEAFCLVLHKPFGTLVHFVQKLLQNAEMHDGMIETMQINALYIDRESIIDNQFALRNDNELIKSYLGMTPKKMVSVDVNNPISEGVSVQLITDTVILNNEWRITGSVQNSWQMLVSLTDALVFSNTKKSILTFTIHGTSPISGVDSDLLLAFSVNSNEYFSALFNMDNAYGNDIGPKCDTSANPTATLNSGDINSIIQNIALTDRRYSHASPQWGTWKPETGSNNWPLIFTIINDPLLKTMFVSVTNPQRSDVQKCGFAQSFTPSKGLDIYIAVDGNGEVITIEKFDVELDLVQSDAATIHLVNIDPSVQIYMILAVVFILSLIICCVTLYMMMKLKYNNEKRSKYKSVNDYADTDTEAIIDQ